MRKYLLILLLLVFACQPVITQAHQVDGTSAYTTEGHEVPEKLLPMTETYEFQWFQTASLLNGLYCILVTVAVDVGEVLDPAEVYAGQLFYIGAAEGTAFLIEYLNTEPVTKPDQVVGLWYLDIDGEVPTWVKIKLPCKFGEIYPRRNPLDFSGPVIDI